MSETNKPAVVAAVTHTVRSLVDGTLSVTIHVEPRHVAQWVQAFGVMPGEPIAVARLNPVAAQSHAIKEQMKSAEVEDYGAHYKCLYLAGWFHNPKVKHAFGVPEVNGPEERIEHIKNRVYIETGVDSLKELPPQAFVALCGLFGVQDTVPRELREAAQGKGV